MRTSLVNLPKRAFLWLFVAIFSTLTGCKTEVSNNYGGSDSQDSERSPGGLTVFREMVKSRKRSTESLLNLSPTLEKRFQTLVWSPNYFPQHDKATVDRIDNWLRSGGKTLVYIGRDFSPNAVYWNRISSQPTSPLNAKARAIGQTQSSNEAIKLDELRDETRPLLITPWFYWRQVPGAFEEVGKFQGEWSGLVWLSKPDIQIRSPLMPFAKGDVDALIKELDWNPATNGGVTPKTGSTTVPPPPRKWFNRTIQRGVVWGNNNGQKVWNTDDRELLAIAKGIQQGDLDSPTTLLATSDGVPLLTEVRYRSSSSRVLILSNISMVSNLGLLNRSNWDLADRIISRFETGAVGFIAGENDPTLRKGLPHEEHKGFEMLTVWPFNAMTIHAALLAIVAAIAAFPIFGRPRIAPVKSSVDFSEHVESLGELLRATDGSQYAKDAISKYFRVVRRDTKSAWATRITAEQRSEQAKPEDEPSPYSDSSNS